jgi:hypothetical protein
MVEDVFVKGVLVRVGDAVNKGVPEKMGSVCQRRNCYFRKKLMSTVILVFLNFYFLINKKIGTTALLFNNSQIKDRYI